MTITARIEGISLVGGVPQATLYPSDGRVFCGRLSTALDVVKENGYVLTNAQDVLMQVHEMGIV